MNNTRLINKLFCGLDANPLEQTDGATCFGESILYLAKLGDRLLDNAIAFDAIELRDIGVDGRLFLQWCVLLINGCIGLFSHDIHRSASSQQSNQNCERSFHVQAASQFVMDS